jgi:D-alanyl-D-alanine carboxypeptidase/D-alanyl-D-alanine-endopeptidase (penicillin-binding protein 4)
VICGPSGSGKSTLIKTINALEPFQAGEITVDGIALHDPSSNKYVYQHQANKLFVPASNVKIVATYAALKYLPTFLPSAQWTELDTAILITPMGDPSFLHPDFKQHPLFDQLKCRAYLNNSQEVNSLHKLL